MGLEEMVRRGGGLQGGIEIGVIDIFGEFAVGESLVIG